MRNRLRHLLLGIIVAAVLVGCAADRNNISALYIASTFDSLLTKQVAFNLIETYVNKYRIPSYVKISSQTARTTDSITPTFSIPILSQKTITQSNTLSRAIQTAGTGLSLQAQTSMEANYSINAVDDPDELRRLRAVFQYSAGHLDDYEFEATYPLIVTGDSSAYDKIDTKGRVYVRRVCLRPLNYDNRCPKYGFTQVRPDFTFVRPPGCIMCDYNTPLTDVRPYAPKNYYLLQKNFNLRGRKCKEINFEPSCDDGETSLMFYRPEQLGPDAIPVNTISGEALQLRGKEGLEAFYELTLFAQEASSQGASGIGSGGQSFGRKTSPLIKISAPTSGGVIIQ